MISKWSRPGSGAQADPPHWGDGLFFNFLSSNRCPLLFFSVSNLWNQSQKPFPRPSSQVPVNTVSPASLPVIL